VLIEYRSGWPIGGFANTPLDPEVKTTLQHAAQAAGARILLVRRHGRRVTDKPASWAVLRYAGGRPRQEWGTWSEPADLLQIVTALQNPGQPGHRPVLLVCTHGRRDVCCAVRGRPVAAALSAAWPELTWECSHIGGDRFAASVLVVPDGVYYGALDPSTAVNVISDHLAGQIDPDHLRGYTDLTPPEQVAVAEMLRRFGPAGRDDLHVLSADHDGPEWTVTVAGQPPLPESATIELHARRRPPAQLTCRAAEPSQAIEYEVVNVMYEPQQL
jgi:hypothetical protein